MKTNPDDKLKSIFEIEHDLKILAKKTIDKTTPLRAKNGWVWIYKNNISKQVHPNKLESYLHDEWKLLNKN